MAKFYIRMDTYWQDSADTWFGPYSTREAAVAAADNSGAGRDDLGQMARDVRNQTRILGIHNATESRKLGRKDRNTIPALEKAPGDIAELAALEEEYMVRVF